MTDPVQKSGTDSLAGDGGRMLARLMSGVCFALGIFSGSAFAAPGCVNAELCTLEELASGASFTVNGFTFSDFEFFGAPSAALEFRNTSAMAYSTGSYWANSGFVMTGAGGRSIIDAVVGPGGSWFFSFDYVVSAPTTQFGDAIFEKALLAATGMQGSGRNTTSFSISQSFYDPGFQHQLPRGNAIAPGSAISEADLGALMESQIGVHTSISVVVGNDTQGDSSIRLASLVERFDGKIPEPSSLLLTGLAAGLCSLFRRPVKS